MRIERAGASDLPEIARLAVELWPDDSLAYWLAEFGELLKSDKDAVFVARTAGKTVGFLHMSLRFDYVEGSSSSPVGYVEGIYVEENARTRGVARSLVAAGERWAKSRGCREIGSDAAADNEASQCFLKKIGFREAARIVAFIKPVE